MMYHYEKPESELLLLSQESSFLASDGKGEGGVGTKNEGIGNEKITFVKSDDYEED